MFNQYDDLISELGLISQIADESVVTDYLVDSITKLKTDTQNLVTDVDARNTLVSILDSALQSANAAGTSVLAFDESSANLKIAESKSFVDSYVNQVSVFSGTTIPPADANFLISKANQISTDSLKRGVQTSLLTTDVILSTSENLINRLESDVDALRSITSSLESLGFEFDITVQRFSPAVGIVSFFNSLTSQNFETVVSSQATAALIMEAVSEELEFRNAIKPSIDELISFLGLSSETADAIAELLNEPAADAIIITAICVGSRGLGCGLGWIIFTEILLVLNENPQILEVLLRKAFEQGSGSLQNFLSSDVVLPKLTVIKQIINDDDGVLTLAGVTLRINGTTVTNGTENIRNAGTYQVSEDPISGYDKVIGGDCDSNGFVTLGVNDTKTCTITNNDVPSTPPPVFFENFDGPTIQGAFGAQWIFNAPGSPVPGFTQRGSVETSFAGFAPPSPPNWGVKSLTGSGTCRSNLSTVHTLFFSHLPAGDYELSATLASTPCSPCGVTTAVRVTALNIGEVGFIEHKAQNFDIEPFDPDKTVSHESKIISLNEGDYRIAATMSPRFLCSGTVSGGFDNISLTPVGAQATSSAASVGGPYFYTEINQTSINATKPTQVTVPLKVEWFDGYYAEPVNVQLFIGNYTDNGIYGTVTSIENATMYKMYDLTFDISNSTQVGQEDIGVLVTEIDSGDTEWKSITFNISE